MLLFVARAALLVYVVAAFLFSGLFDNGLTILLYAAAALLALYGLFEPRASLAALACVLLATGTSWLPGNPGH